MKSRPGSSRSTAPSVAAGRSAAAPVSRRLSALARSSSRCPPSNHTLPCPCPPSQHRRLTQLRVPAVCLNGYPPRLRTRARRRPQVPRQRLPTRLRVPSVRLNGYLPWPSRARRRPRMPSPRFGPTTPMGGKRRRNHGVRRCSGAIRERVGDETSHSPGRCPDGWSPSGTCRRTVDVVRRLSLAPAEPVRRMATAPLLVSRRLSR